jgi:hypothetical protein
MKLKFRLYLKCVLLILITVVLNGICEAQDLQRAQIETELRFLPPPGVASSNINIPTTTNEAASIKPHNNTQGFDVVDAIPLSIYAPTGLCFDGKYFWIPNYGVMNGSCRIYKIDIQARRIIDSIPSPSLWTTGMAWDGKYLWVSDMYYHDFKLFKLSTTGQIMQYIPAIYSCYWGGIAWDGTYLYYGVNTCGVPESRRTSMIFKVNPQNGALLDSIPPPSGYVNALTYDRGFFWYCDINTLRIYKITTKGEVVTSFAAPGRNPSGLAIANGYLWNVDLGTNTLYKINIGIAPSSPHILSVKSKYNSVTITWQAGIFNTGVVEYRIYRNSENNVLTAQCIDSVSGSTTTYTDRNAINGKMYYYWISAVTNDLYESPFSNSTYIFVDLSIPYSIGAFSDTGKVTFEWDDISEEGVSYYKIYRSDAGSSEIFARRLIDSVFAPNHSYIDSNFIRSGYYIYRMSTADSQKNESKMSMMFVGKPLLPDHMRLHQNYPNPFNGLTKIRYEMPNSAIGRLDIFNTLGQIIKTYSFDHRYSGYYSLTFDALRFSSGIYFYRFQTGSFSETKKLVVIK